MGKLTIFKCLKNNNSFVSESEKRQTQKDKTKDYNKNINLLKKKTPKQKLYFKAKRKREENLKTQEKIKNTKTLGYYKYINSPL